MIAGAQPRGVLRRGDDDRHSLNVFAEQEKLTVRLLQARVPAKGRRDQHLAQRDNRSDAGRATTGNALEQVGDNPVTARVGLNEVDDPGSTQPPVSNYPPSVPTLPVYHWRGSATRATLRDRWKLERTRTSGKVVGCVTGRDQEDSGDLAGMPGRRG